MTTVEPQEPRLNLVDMDGEPSPASNSPTDHTPPEHVRQMANMLLWIFAVCVILIILLATSVAFWREQSLKDIIGFFGTVIATLGTLLGGVVAFYFARR
jgi:hypothetical protein